MNTLKRMTSAAAIVAASGMILLAADGAQAAGNYDPYHMPPPVPAKSKVANPAAAPSKKTTTATGHTVPAAPPVSSTTPPPAAAPGTTSPTSTLRPLGGSSVRDHRVGGNADPCFKHNNTCTNLQRVNSQIAFENAHVTKASFCDPKGPAGYCSQIVGIPDGRGGEKTFWVRFQKLGGPPILADEDLVLNELQKSLKIAQSSQSRGDKLKEDPQARLQANQDHPTSKLDLNSPNVRKQ